MRNIVIKEYTLHDGDILSIGRHPRSAIVLTDPTVSRAHIGVARKGEDLVVWDKGSRNGMLVNGEKVLAAKLKDGDIVRIGEKTCLKAGVNPKKKRESTIDASDNS